VLDIGCGSGELTFLLTKVGARPFAFDYSREALRSARAALPGTALLRADASALPFARAAFAKAAALGIIGFLSREDLRRAIGECARVLAPGGVLVICTGTPWNAVGSLLLRLRSGKLVDRGARSHLYTASTYRRELEGAGFRVRMWRKRYGAPPGLLARLVDPFFAPRWIRADLGLSGSRATAQS
jgi:SAM-dependent methyltransferase